MEEVVAFFGGEDAVEKFDVKVEIYVFLAIAAVAAIVVPIVLYFDQPAKQLQRQDTQQLTASDSGADSGIGNSTSTHQALQDKPDEEDKKNK